MVWRCPRPAPHWWLPCTGFSRGFGNKANRSDRKRFAFPETHPFSSTDASDGCRLVLNFWVSLESIWTVFVAGFVTFVEEQQITLFLDNLIVSLKVIFTVFSAEVEPRAWYREELHIPASLLLYI